MQLSGGTAGESNESGRESGSGELHRGEEESGTRGRTGQERSLVGVEEAVETKSNQVVLGLLPGLRRRACWPLGQPGGIPAYGGASRSSRPRLPSIRSKYIGHRAWGFSGNGTLGRLLWSISVIQYVGAARNARRRTGCGANGAQHARLVGRAIRMQGGCHLCFCRASPTLTFQPSSVCA